MPENASRRGAADMGMSLMILAFVVAGGFFYWLSVQAASERALDIVEDTVSVDEIGADVPDVALRELEIDPEPYVGTEVRFTGFGVASMLGSQSFWLGTGTGNPFLVSMSAEMVAEGNPVAVGDTVTVVGTINVMNDSTLNAWTEAALIGGSDRIVAEFATYFMDATAVRVTSVGGTDPGN